MFLFLAAKLLWTWATLLKKNNIGMYAHTTSILYFLGHLAYQSKYNHYRRPNASSIRCFHRTKDWAGTNGVRKKAVDLVNEHEETQWKYKYG